MSLLRLCKRLAAGCPGIMFRWKDELIEDGVSYPAISTGKIGPDSLEYDRIPGQFIQANRKLSWIRETEEIVTAKVTRTLFGVRLDMHSRQIYDSGDV